MPDKYQSEWTSQAGAVIRPGDRIRIARRRAVYLVQFIVARSHGQVWLVVCGPSFDSPSIDLAGQAVYVGKPSSRKSAVTGKRIPLKPVRITKIK